MDHTRAKVILIADSRGKALIKPLRDQQFNVKVLSYPGHGIKMSTTRSLTVIREWRPHLVTLAASICDITIRDHVARVIYMRKDNIDESISYYMTQVRDAIKQINNIDDKVRIQCTTAIGLDLTDANHSDYTKLTGLKLREYRVNKTINLDQDRLNRTVLAINKEIVLLNRANDIQTAWTANCVHAYKHGNTLHRYTKLIDGCHFTDTTAAEWAKILCTSYTKMHDINSDYSNIRVPPTPNSPDCGAV